MDRPWLNAIAKCRRIDPASYLKGRRPLTSGADPRVKGLRSNAFRKEHTLVEASLFCHGLSCRRGQPIWIVDDKEDHAYDFVATRKENDDDYFAPTQLKEVFKKHLQNPKPSIQSVIDDLGDRYAGFTVAIRINQTTISDLDEIIIPPTLRISALWVYAATSQDGSRWFIHGNLMESKPESWFFDYPV
jgi:hypothetical protein